MNVGHGMYPQCAEKLSFKKQNKKQTHLFPVVPHDGIILAK